MTSKEDKILYSCKPSIWYYLLALFFPVMFFLIDDSVQLILGPWSKSSYLFNLLALFMFFGIPFLMVVLRREITIYAGKVAIYKPAINSLKTYYFKDLVKWNVTEIYIPKAGRQVNLTLKFKSKKLIFNKIELTGFSALIKFLEANFKDKKQ